MNSKAPALGALACSLVLAAACTRESITAVNVAEVSVSPPSVSTPEGERVQFAATVRDDQHEQLEGAPVVWSSDDESVVVVDQEGNARAVAPGTARILATFRDVTGEAQVTVIATAPPDGDGSGGGGDACLVEVTDLCLAG